MKPVIPLTALPQPGANDHGDDAAALANAIKTWGKALGFSAVGISDIDTAAARPRLAQWLAKGYHGEMNYLAAHGLQRLDPRYVLPEAVSVIAVSLPYFGQSAPLEHAWKTLADGQQAYIARYALGRDYHKVMRQLLKKLATKITAHVPQARLRLAVDSAPLPEVELAVKAGIGWRGKHTLLINRQGGSFFFLGEIVTNLVLPADTSVTAHCGTCTRCIDVCPTRAIIAPQVLDARRCIAYLTIELAGSIPVELRPLIGNRIYGCDDCQLICPWNKFATTEVSSEFAVRHELDTAGLLTLLDWSSQQFNTRLEGSPIRRIGYARWLRNIAVGLGNASASGLVLERLRHVRDDLASRLSNETDKALVAEHIDWAINQHQSRP